jgi:hypothetical protein
MLRMAAEEQFVPSESTNSRLTKLAVQWFRPNLLLMSMLRQDSSCVCGHSRQLALPEASPDLQALPRVSLNSFILAEHVSPPPEKYVANMWVGKS